MIPQENRAAVTLGLKKAFGVARKSKTSATSKSRMSSINTRHRKPSLRPESQPPHPLAE